ncbi:MAG: GAF domain-containing sensor histidine kinase [Cellvibrionaceae bacterium]|nr:GAF domain-containing sensor histidine kinase [Cellvibrionaceae bacterium]
MLEAPQPANETARLQALFDYEVMDTAAEPNFDELTELASSICQTPISLVSLLDEHRQWFKSHHGLAASETPRNVAFCSHAILEDGIMEVADSRQDERFADNPLVTGEPHVIFYAGVPLTTPEGYKLGTLCVIDHQPRQLCEQQRRQLHIIANQVISQLELRKKTRLRDQLFIDLMATTDSINKKNAALHHFFNRATHDLQAPLRQIHAFAQTCIQDLQKQNIEEAVKHFHFIDKTSVSLNQQLSNIFELARADLHQDTVELINFQQIVTQAIAEANDLEQSDKVQIAHNLNCQQPFYSQRLRLRQMIYQLISNSVKFHNPEQAAPWVNISIAVNTTTAVITVRDNGLGIPARHQEKLYHAFERFHPDVAAGSGLGTAIIAKHVEQLQGTISFTSSEQGTEFVITLPNVNKKSQRLFDD